MAGSDKRQRTEQVKTRLTPGELAELTAMADRAGMTTGAFLRAAAFGSPGVRSQRRLPVDATLLRQVLGHLGRIGSNLNQIARRLNEGALAHTQLPELAEALRDFARLRDMIYAALGKAPDEAPAKEPAPSKFIDPKSPG